MKALRVYISKSGEPMNDKLNIDSYYSISDQQVESFKTNGFIKLKNVLSKDEIKYYEQEISKIVLNEKSLHLPMEARNTYQKAFLQIGNLWLKSKIVKQLVFSKRFAKIATDLLEVDGVRLYHDQALYKEANGGYTPWHADQYYWPLETEKTCTIWIPLQETNLEMGPLYFAAKSHLIKTGRELEISDESEIKIKDILRKAESEIPQEPFELGEVSYHYGWTFHRAGENKSKTLRKVMTMIYMDKDMRLSKPKNKNQEADRMAFCPEIEAGEIIDTELTPIIFIE
jgi:ectoine hydroxylase-related dioxygenase (phytanoyl-CoA dioxygenase family)